MSSQRDPPALETTHTSFAAAAVAHLIGRVRALVASVATEQRKRERLGRYFSPAVAERLQTRDGDGVAPEAQELTVLFSDIRDFTTLSGALAPPDVVRLLNEYYGHMVETVFRHGGTLDKFIGDAMVIFFGDPDTRGVKEDALQCVKMALAMQRRMTELQILWREMGSDKAFQVRMGINTGFCDVGNFGSDLRMDYTIIGSEVNLAARLEQSAEPGGILISRETYALVRDEIIAEAHLPVVAKGFAEPLEAYSVLEEAGEQPAAGKVFQWERLGMRVLIDLDRLPSAERAAAAVELREMADRLH